LFRAPNILKNTHLKPARHVHIIGRGGFDGILNSVDGGTTWRMGFSGLDEQVDPKTFDAKARIREKIGIDVEMEIVAALPWARATKSAERYSKDRVFLVGDSAHTWSPTGGFGMNTGLNDAVDISWKLAAVIKGWGGSKLLNTYDIERRPVCEGIIAEARQNYVNLRIEADYKKVMMAGAEGDIERRQLATKIQSTIRREYETIGVQMGYHYDASPIIVDDGSDFQSYKYDTYAPTARPGHIAPHSWLEDGRSTMDLFGDGYTLLSFKGSNIEGLVAAAHQVGMPLSVELISDNKIAKKYEAKLVVIRPDGHVAWRGDEEPDDALAFVDQIRGT
jgi:hypothetical protein